MSRFGLCQPCDLEGRERYAVLCIDAVNMCAACARVCVSDIETRFPKMREASTEEVFAIPTLAMLPPMKIEKPTVPPVRFSGTYTVHPKSPIVRFVCEETALHFGFTVAELRTRSKSAVFITMRQVAVFILREHAPVSCTDLGRILDQHHTTILHTYDVAKQRYDSEQGFRETVGCIWARATHRRITPSGARQTTLLSWAEQQTVTHHNLHATVSEIKTMWQQVGAA